MNALHNKTVVITGAGRGIGRATAIYLAQQGAAVVVNDLDADVLEEVVTAIKSTQGIAIGVAGSVTDPSFCEQLINLAVERYGRLDALINNAGLHYVCAPWAENPNSVKQLVEVNILGTMYCGLQALRVFKAQGYGSVVNVSSGAHLGVEDQAIYSATKGAIASLTYSWALDVMAYGVRVNAVAPLAVTRMIDSLPQFQTAAMQPANTIAPLFAFLVADESSAITGQIIRFNGRDLSLIDHPQVAAQQVSNEVWDINHISQAFEQSLQQQLSPVGLGASEYRFVKKSEA